MTPLGAAKTYANIAQQAVKAATGQGGNALEAAGGATPKTFADMVSSAVNDATSQAQKADQVSAAAVAGQADLVSVVTAISETELAMETLVGLRDRVIGAYEQIMRMPI
ncbi:MAG: flagellar hook-basal body complex protein FliE [Rhodobiaceae bacterium]|nr:flagellar hook-basal body complex protein FliE [Rhodobiaceae bacterium]MCC0012206.1 flagellar hook-basal body complex protein FliE [Rhodobiaceae bacterium]MCC0050938.1 flagellar hook-basal body complex protein FliE [Rhodobiaceae bacterium]MCC0060879.1 flagellar hook-basal body complex protein FliE [Rhodobiaceae bacterium]